MAGRTSAARARAALRGRAPARPGRRRLRRRRLVRGGVTYGLGAGMDIDAALEWLPAAAPETSPARGPYAGQPTAEDLELPRDGTRL